MIDTRTPLPVRRRRIWFAAVMVAALLVAGGLLLPTVWASGPPVPMPVASAVVPAPALAASAAPPAAVQPAPARSVPQTLLSLPGAVPARGSGTFAYAPGRGRILGTAGGVRRFRVAVEHGSGEDLAAFATQVEATLGDRRSWIGDGRFRLQRVPAGEKVDFTVFLATRETAGRMCADGGVNITVGGRPYTSCRTTGRAIVNLDRWRLSAPPYVAAKVPLPIYRRYVVNHEVGHELGHGHQGCPKRGGPAPVMVQQTLTLRGCVPYAWPRRDNRLFQGPALR
ncbi:DUF3152 domain-containing protein [Actinoplanes sp. NPDC049316]|uniref:DUF3152 domain-containing protein n=1 Tax=Actinoplanes sp. NPDC049316 TaxID=3154727 RepID=UPI00342616B9